MIGNFPTLYIQDERNLGLNRESIQLAADLFSPRLQDETCKKIQQIISERDPFDSSFQQEILAAVQDTIQVKKMRICSVDEFCQEMEPMIQVALKMRSITLVSVLPKDFMGENIQDNALDRFICCSLREDRVEKAIQAVQRMSDSSRMNAALEEIASYLVRKGGEREIEQAGQLIEQIENEKDRADVSQRISWIMKTQCQILVSGLITAETKQKNIDEAIRITCLIPDEKVRKLAVKFLSKVNKNEGIASSLIPFYIGDEEKTEGKELTHAMQMIELKTWQYTQEGLQENHERLRWVIDKRFKTNAECLHDFADQQLKSLAKELILMGRFDEAQKLMNDIRSVLLKNEINKEFRVASRIKEQSVETLIQEHPYPFLRQRLNYLPNPQELEMLLDSLVE